MRRIAYEAAALVVAACHGGGAGAAPAPGASAPESAPVAGLALPAPDAVGPLMILDISLPEAGRSIGGRFEGTAYAVQTAGLLMSDGLRTRWSRALRAAGDSVLRAAGYRVESMGPPSSDATPIRTARFALDARVNLSVKSYGRIAPVRVDASAEVDWALVDLAAGGSVLEMRATGSARLDDSLDLAVVRAMTSTLAQVVADTSFRRALGSPRPRRFEDLLFASSWREELPGPDDTVIVAPGDFNVADDDDAVQRVAHGVFSVHGRDTPNFTAFTISKGGLALAAAVPLTTQLFGRFHDGLDRPVRIVRSRQDVVLLEVQCDGPCRTVPWSDTAVTASRERIFVLAGPRYARDPIYLAWGRLDTPRPGEAQTPQLSVDGDVGGGEPVARRSDGVVFAMFTHGQALPIAEALRRVGVAHRNH